VRWQAIAGLLLAWGNACSNWFTFGDNVAPCGVLELTFSRA
jgi:hypothetical protein